VKRRNAVQTTLESAATPLLAGALAVAAVDIARRLFRHTQLFCPKREPEISWNPADYGIPRDRVDEVWFETNDGELLHGWYCRAERPVASGVFCHGNTGNLTTTAPIIPHLLDAGFSVLMFDYRGFGRSSGRPSFSGVVADGVCAARFHERIRPKQLPSILYGYSLGGAIAAQVIRHHPFDALILQSTFTNLPDITRATWPRLPLHLFAGNLFDTKGVLPHLKVPLMIIHGSSDEVVPAWMAQALYDACPSMKRIYMVEGALHKTCYDVDSDRLIWAVNQFIADLPHAHYEPLGEEKPGAVDQWIDAAFRYVRRQLRRRLTPASS
jgi:alpha-beta hydrolase superfamily lysophospholipase